MVNLFFYRKFNVRMPLVLIEKANSKFYLKIEEALHVNWRKPNFNAQQNYLALTLSL